MTVLDAGFYKGLVMLENKLLKNQFQIDDIAALLSKYATCVEQYNNRNDAIEYYFIDKINATVALQSTIDKLFDQPTDTTNHKPARDTVAMYINRVHEQGFAKQDIAQDYQFQKKEQKHLFKMNLELKKEEYSIDVEGILKQFEEKQSSNNQVLFDDLEEQVAKLKRSLENKGDELFQEEPIEKVMGENQGLRQLMTQMQSISQQNRTTFTNQLTIEQELQRASMAKRMSVTRSREQPRRGAVQ